MKLSFLEWFQLCEADDINRTHFDQFRSMYMDPFIKAIFDFSKLKPNWLDRESKNDLEKYYQSMAFFDELGFKFGKAEYGDKFKLGSAHPRLNEIIEANIKDPKTGEMFFKNEVDFRDYLDKSPTYNPANRESKRIAQVKNVHDLLKFLFHQRLANATANLQKKAGIGQTGEEGGDLEGTMVGQHRTAAQVQSTETVNTIIDCLREFYAGVEAYLAKKITDNKIKIDGMLNNDESDPLFLSQAKLNIIFYAIAKLFNDKTVTEREFDGVVVPTTTNTLKSQKISEYLSRKSKTITTLMNDHKNEIVKFFSSDPLLSEMAPKIYASLIYLLNISQMDRSQFADFSKTFVNTLPDALKTSMGEEHLKNLRSNYLLNPNKILFRGSNPPQSYNLSPDGLFNLMIDANFARDNPAKLQTFVSPLFLLLHSQGQLTSLDCESLKKKWQAQIAEVIN